MAEKKNDNKIVSDTDIPTWQQVTDQGATTTNAIKVTGTDGFDLEPGFNINYLPSVSTGTLLVTNNDGEYTSLKIQAQNNSLGTLVALLTSYDGTEEEEVARFDRLEEGSTVSLTVPGEISAAPATSPESLTTLSQLALKADLTVLNNYDTSGQTDQKISALDLSLAVVAKSGSYNDLINKPIIPSPYTYNSDYLY